MPARKWRDLGLSYTEALHGMQTAVKYEMSKKGLPDYERGPTSPKHLRTGLNSAMAEHGALAWLLVQKGVITEDEYKEAIRLAMNEELVRYESDHPGITFR